jgi:hypothetical protein
MGQSELEIGNESGAMPRMWEGIVCDGCGDRVVVFDMCTSFFSRRWFKITGFWFVILVPLRTTNTALLESMCWLQEPSLLH